MPFLDNTLLFQRTAIQCSSVTKLYSAVAWLFDSVPFPLPASRCCSVEVWCNSEACPSLSFAYQSYSMSMRTLQFLRAANLSYAFARQSEAVQRCTIHFRCFTPHYISALFHVGAVQGWAKLFHGFSIQRKSVSWLRYAAACPIQAELFPANHGCAEPSQIGATLSTPLPNQAIPYQFLSTPSSSIT